MKKYIHVIYGLVGGILWGIYTLLINRYYQTDIFKALWKIDNIKELFSESIVNNIVCVVASFGFGILIWKFKWNRKIRDFVIRNKKQIVIVIINGLLSGTVATVLYHLAVQFSGEIYASAVKTSYIPLSSLYTWFLLKKPNWKAVVGVVLATSSIVLIGFLDGDKENVINLPVGIIAATLVGLCWTAEAILTSKVIHHPKENEELEPAIFISYRQLVSLIGVTISAYILYPILVHIPGIDSKLNEKIFSWDWVFKIGFNWNSVGWLVIGSAFNSISDFYYYWSFKGLSIPTATTMNNLDTPFGFIYTLLIIVTGGSIIFGNQSIPSIEGIILIFILLIGSLLVILYDDNDFIKDDGDEVILQNESSRNIVFMKYFIGLGILFVSCAYVAHGSKIDLNNWKQPEPKLSEVKYEDVQKLVPNLKKDEIKEIVKSANEKD